MTKKEALFLKEQAQKVKNAADKLYDELAFKQEKAQLGYVNALVRNIIRTLASEFL